MFCVGVFGCFKPLNCPIYIEEIYYAIYWIKCSLNWPKKHVKNLNYFFPNGASNIASFVCDEKSNLLWRD